MKSSFAEDEQNFTPKQLWKTLAAMALVIAGFFYVFHGHVRTPDAVMQDSRQAMSEGDFAKGGEILEQANTPQAKFDLANLYKNGLGVAQDPQKALALMTEAAEAGLPEAQTVLGLWYANGDGVAADPSAAVEWYRKAEGRDSNAAMLLGLAYASGQGVEQDMAAAYKWISVAAQQGNPDAEADLEVVGAALDPQQRDEAENAAREIFVKEQNAAQQGGGHE